jgi:soluble cytochrome b562
MKGFQKGHKLTPKHGRGKGTPNKVTRDLRDAFKLLAENNIDNLEKWLKQVAQDNPEKALKLFIDLSEYIIPKLNRTEIIEQKEEEKTIIIWGGKEVTI